MIFCLSLFLDIEKYWNLSFLFLEFASAWYEWASYEYKRNSKKIIQKQTLIKVNIFYFIFGLGETEIQHAKVRSKKDRCY